ncbi:OmpA family protein [Paracrocinitomix mangrovi]|uniref:OmpA family protein n=1 Tax=Paracrocinitomix mangrovi TaxID=2862509 RepID=UPI001C8CFA13|nr:OmpA family protein [Paracrocinitomix mangrovi]UKN00115.1 OmpA family protein [Paracrocinitomix mangrovi]
MYKAVLFISTVLVAGLSLKAQTPTILDHKGKIEIKNLSNLNSSARENNLSITPDGKYLFFKSDRGGQTWSSYSGTYKGKVRYDGDIWYSKKSGESWGNPRCLGLGVNTSSGEDEPMVSQDGQFISYQSWKYNWKTTGGPYYTAELNGSSFSNIKGMGGGINKFILVEFIKAGNTYATDGAALSPDGKTFLLCAGRDYDGNMDIYISRKVNGQWTYMKKLNISTPGDERSIFIAGDGKTVYFASDGHGGYGGMDMFKTTLNDDGTCGEVINVGAPFNTSADDYGLILTADGNEGYFVREGDIYYANTKEADPRLKPGVTVLISGTIKDQNGKPLQYYLELDDVATSKEISTSKSNSNSGEFLFSTSDVTAKYRIRDDNHKFIDTTFTVKIKDGVGKVHLDIVVNVPKNTESHEKKISVMFERDASVLDAEDKKLLDEIVNISHSSIEYEVEIVGMSDAHGSSDYNKKMSLERANKMKSYLVAQGLKAEKIKVLSEPKNLSEVDNDVPAAQRHRKATVTINYTN